ncbi:hypothetical protein TNCV_4140361 [Trichonephila clavipes]|nr:hypothetical protein TNCV_4140361 [Trichonephila clavipes]
MNLTAQMSPGGWHLTCVASSPQASITHKIIRFALCPFVLSLVVFLSVLSCRSPPSEEISLTCPGACSAALPGSFTCISGKKAEDFRDDTVAFCDQSIMEYVH